jgi:hypothetical protein
MVTIHTCVIVHAVTALYQKMTVIQLSMKLIAAIASMKDFSIVPIAATKLL